MRVHSLLKSPERCSTRALPVTGVRCCWCSKGGEYLDFLHISLPSRSRSSSAENHSVERLTSSHATTLFQGMGRAPWAELGRDGER
jgi:hypothetical protein